jgi:hypothetical protein
MIVRCNVADGDRPQCAWWGGDRAETNDVHGPGGRGRGRAGTGDRGGAEGAVTATADWDTPDGTNTSTDVDLVSAIDDAVVDLRGHNVRGHNVRSPIAVRPVGVAVAPELTQQGASGSVTLPVCAGFAGTLTATAAGLVPGQVEVRHLVGNQQRFDRLNPAAGPGVAKLTVSAPAGTKAVRFATFDAEQAPSADIDVYAYKAGTPRPLDASNGSTAQESAVAFRPGDYDVYVVQFAAGAPAGNLAATPASQPVGLGAGANVTVAWTGLAAGTHYFGAVGCGSRSGGILYQQEVECPDERLFPSWRRPSWRPPRRCGRRRGTP